MEQQDASDLLKQIIDQSYQKGFDAGKQVGLDAVTNDLIDFLSNYKVRTLTATAVVAEAVADVALEPKEKKVKAVTKGPKITKKNRTALSVDADNSLSSLRKAGLPWKVYELIVDKNSVGGIATKRIFSHLSSLKSTRGKQLSMATLNVSLNTLMTKRLITYTGKGSDRVWFLVD